MATKMKPSEVKKKLKSRLEALAKVAERVREDAATALEEMQSTLPSIGPCIDPMESIEDAIDSVGTCHDELQDLAEKLEDVMTEQAQIEEELERLETAKAKPTVKAADDATLDRIALALKGEWDADVFSEVAAMVRATGRKV